VNYTIVGAFVLVLGAVLIAGVLWIASGSNVHKKFDMYQAIEEESVAGLNLNAPVKYYGVEVGKVTDIRLDPANPDKVRLIFAIEHGTPVKTDTVAVQRTQGLTGIAYIELGGSTRASPLMPATDRQPYPVIRTKPSLSTRLENVLTTLLAKLDRTSGNVDALLSDQNLAALKSALADIAVVARTVAARKDVIDAGIVSAARTAENSARVTAQLAPLLPRIGRAADAIEKMGTEVALAGSTTSRTVGVVGADVQRFTAATLPEIQRLIGELNDLSISLRRLSEQTTRDPAALLRGRQPVPNGPGETSTPRVTP
jgi:phospholipid/cholesterol/gamma-HCH transport system substrate-binding protein